MDPLVSIIIPVYNKASFLRETLDSALSQTYSNTELVLVNDGSKDDSLSILEKYQSIFPKKVRLINQKNSGVSRATNVGIEASIGEYIQFLDADDLLSPNKIAHQIKLLQGNSKSALSTCEWQVFEEEVEKALSFPYGVFRDFDSGLDLLLRFWNEQEMMAISSYLTHRSLIEKAGDWDENLTINQDGEFFSRVLLYTEKVLFEPAGRVYYRTPALGNVSQQKSHQAIKSLLDSYQACERVVVSVENSPRVRIALKKLYQKFIYDVYPQYMDLVEKAENLMEELGVKERTYIGGPKFQCLSKLFGFKNALRLKRILN
ncbi:MAG: glycosyltransferase family 2 protein [Flavobacteriaceae bacterium]|nr:glycosyltransferase family 2 protein [Flavobacteriaceae bacterium]